MRILFFASDEFAHEPLERLLESRHDVLAVVSRPDRPAGRGMRECATAAVEHARSRELEVWRPEDLTREVFYPFIEPVGWDVGVVVAYGGLIPGWLIDAPPSGFVNVHPSLLPRFRGAAPIRRAIISGASITGITTIRMNEVLDAGDILLHREVPIEDDDTAGTLRSRLSHLGARLLVETIDALEDGVLTPVPQEDDKATYAPPVTQAEAEIDWRRSAEEIVRLIRAMNPEPGAWTCFRDRRIKIWTAHMTDVPPEGDPGTIMNLGKEGFIVNTETTGVQVATLQPEGRNRMTGAEFSRGQRLLVAERFAAAGRG